MGAPGAGFFVSVEGIDGSGKSTQARLLAERLALEGEAVTSVRDPGTTALGERIRELLLENSSREPPDPFAEVALFLAARLQLLHEVIEPALTSGRVVVCDRYLDSTLAYQGAGRGLDQRTLLELHRLVGAGRMPELTIILDLELAAARMRFTAEKSPDRMEAESTEYHERVRQGYLGLALEFPGRVVVVPADISREELSESCWRVTRERLMARRST